MDPSIASTKLQVLCRNLRRYLMRKVHPCVGKSRTWAEIWPFQVSAVFIDAGHDLRVARILLGRINSALHHSDQDRTDKAA